MRAAWYDKVGLAREVLTVGDLALPEPAPDEVRIRIRVSGVNPSDVKARAGARGPAPSPRIVPHSDGAGVIDSVGSNVDAKRIGQRVWLWNAAWKRALGSCAEYVCLPSSQAVPLPDNTSFEAGACLGIPASTAAWAVFADGDVRGQTILVTGGAGAVGRYAIQMAKWGGARVITTVSGDAKADHARSAGADVVLNYRSGDLAEAIRAASDGDGVDRIVDVEFGGNLAVSNAVLKPNGVIATYGSMAAPVPEIPFYPMMFNGTVVRMILIYLLSAQDRQRVSNLVNKALRDGALDHAFASRHSLANVARAHEDVESGLGMGTHLIEIGDTPI